MEIYARLKGVFNHRIFFSQTNELIAKIVGSFTPGPSEWTFGHREDHGNDMLEIDAFFNYNQVRYHIYVSYHSTTASSSGICSRV